MCNSNLLKIMQQVNSTPSIDLKIVFSEDASEWDKYLTDCLIEAIENVSYQLQIVHERIENVQLNKFQEENEQLSISNLIILSPDFVNYVQENDRLKDYFRQFKSDCTLCMLCGVKEIELTKKLKDNLISFDNWKCLQAKEQDNEFIFSVIDTVCNILYRKKQLDEIYSPYSLISSIKSKRQIPNYSNEYKNLDSIKIDEQLNKKIKSKFKLLPRKIRKGNNKVFILLDQPIENRYKIKVTLEFKTPSKSNQKCKQELVQIDVKKKNPYTLQFLVADDLLTSTKVIRVNLFLEHNSQTNQIGSRLLKCENDKDENLILNLNSNCISILMKSLELNTKEELDLELAKRFKRIVPIDQLNHLVNKDECNLVEPQQIKQKPIIEDLLTGDLTEQLDVKSNQQESKKNDINKKLNLKNILIDKNSKTKDQEHPTLLHFAAEFNLINFTSSLLEFKPSIDLLTIKNCNGLTPLLIAKLNEHKEISQLIKKYTKDDKEQIDQLDQNKLICDLDYVNMSIVKIPNKNEQQTSDFTSDSSDQSSIDGADSVDGLIKSNKCKSTINDYDFIEKIRPIRLGKLIDLDNLSTSTDNSNEELLLPPKLAKINSNLINLNNELKRENHEYDIIKASPRRANLNSPSLINRKDLNCKTNLFERFNELRISSSSSTSSNQTDDKLNSSFKSIDLKTSNLSESQIELMKLIKAFKKGEISNDEMEKKFKQWAIKYKYKIDHSNQFDADSLNMNRMVKRSVSSTHLLSQDTKLEFKDSGCSSRSSTMKTCLSNINLNANHSPKLFRNKQFILTDWFHQLTAKLKQKTDKNELNELKHKSPKFEKKEKIISPSKLSSNWTKRLSSSNVLGVRKSLAMSKEFEKFKSSKSPTKNNSIDIQTSKIKSLTLPLRNQPATKNLSPTSKLKNKLNFKKNSKSNLLNDVEKSKINSKLMNDKLKEKLSTKLNDKMINLTEKFADNINNNISNKLPTTKSIGYSSLDSWDIKICNNQIDFNFSNDYNTHDYDKINPFPQPVLAQCRKN